LKVSTKTIGRMIRRAGLVGRRQDLGEVIEGYWPQMVRLGLPRYGFTARDVGKGGVWYA